MRALVLSQIPDPHITPSVAANQLPLVRVNNHVIDRDTVCIIALYIPTASIPDLHGAVFGRCDEPLRLAMERYARDIGGVAVEGENGIGVGRFDVV
jgi:hypothetical protein